MRIKEKQTINKDHEIPPLTHYTQDFFKLDSKSYDRIPNEAFQKETNHLNKKMKAISKKNKDDENMLLSFSSMSVYCEMIDASSIGILKKRLKISDATQNNSNKRSRKEIFKKAAQNSSKTKLLLLQKLNEDRLLNKNNSNIDGTFECCYRTRSPLSRKQKKLKTCNSQSPYYNDSSLEKDLRSRATYDRLKRVNSSEIIDILLIISKNALFFAILLLIIWPLTILLKSLWIISKYVSMFFPNLNYICIFIDELSCKVLNNEKFIMNKLLISYFSFLC
jgi:hypothetical protein